MPDSFSPRGLVTTADDQSQLGRLAMVVDAYRALAILSRHPRIDPSRIGLMGFSRGGQAALYASLKRFQRMHAPADAAFALFMAFYPECVTRYREDDDVVDAPIRVFHGTDDDYNPIAPCRDYVERLRRAGKDARLVEFPGAHHVFDAASLKSPVKLPNAQTLRRCRIEEEAEGRLIDTQTKQPFTYSAPCVERGPTLAYDPGAHAHAVLEVTRLVTTFLKGRMKRGVGDSRSACGRSPRASASTPLSAWSARRRRGVATIT